MCRCGLVAVNIGVEPGSEKVRERYLKRLHSNADVKATVAAAKQSALTVMVYVLVGIPRERVADFRQTVLFITRNSAARNTGAGVPANICCGADYGMLGWTLPLSYYLDVLSAIPDFGQVCVCGSLWYVRR
jgi:hypothetical protein